MSSLHRDARRRELDARVPFTRPLTLKLVQPLCAVAAKAGNHCRAALHDVAHPVQGLEVVLQRRAAKQPHLRDVGRARRARPFAFDAFDHGRLLAADVGARAAPQSR